MGVDIKVQEILQFQRIYNSTNISYSLGINIPGEQQSSSKHMQGEQVHLSHAQHIPIWGISVISIFPPMVYLMMLTHHVEDQREDFSTLDFFNLKVIIS